MSNVSENITRIRRISSTFQSVFNFLILGVPFTISMYWVLFKYLPIGITEGLLPAPVNKPLSAEYLFAGLVVSLIPTIPALYGIVNLKNLFRLYEKEIIFSSQNAKYILRFGYCLIAWVPAKWVFVALMSAVLTFDNLPGDQMVVIQIDISDITMLITGSVVILISWVMKEATILKEEQEYTV